MSLVFLKSESEARAREVNPGQWAGPLALQERFALGLPLASFAKRSVRLERELRAAKRGVGAPHRSEEASFARVLQQDLRSKTKLRFVLVFSSTATPL